jgi:hypothetical protein
VLRSKREERREIFGGEERETEPKSEGENGRIILPGKR